MKNKSMRKRHTTHYVLHDTGRAKGFTLVEMLIVMGIIGVLSALIIPNIISGRGRARDAVRKSDLANIKSALRIYYNDFQQYPLNNAGGDILGCGVNGDSVCTWGSGSFSAGDNVYMKKLPDGPTGGEYTYTQNPDGEGFLLEVTMENEGDEEILESQNRCGVSLASDVYVTCEK